MNNNEALRLYDAVIATPGVDKSTLKNCSLAAASLRGDAQASFQSAARCETGLDDMYVDPQEALRCYQRAVAQGYPTDAAARKVSQLRREIQSREREERLAARRASGGGGRARSGRERD